ncbi:hypothetical protein AB5N19_05633 [Seiridium cardinale]
MLAILRMIDVVSGRILLGDIDLAAVEGSVVRQKLNCLTQDPFLFSGTLGVTSTLQVTRLTENVTVLEKVGLWSIVESKVGGNSPGPSDVLDNVMDADFLSHRQQQVFCLARAMLKSGKVLILDEPTSSVDLQTDTKMQEIIRFEFKTGRWQEKATV